MYYKCSSFTDQRSRSRRYTTYWHKKIVIHFTNE